jgi:hypothetical protein
MINSFIVAANLLAFQRITENPMNVLLSTNPSLEDVLNQLGIIKELKGQNIKLIN